MSTDFAIARVTPGDLPDLLPLMRGYCSFYEETRGTDPPSDAALQALAAALLADPEHEGIQLLARAPDGTAAGFATLFWTWSTLAAARIAVMNDLYVDPSARGTGLADALILACRDAARERGAVRVDWCTAPANTRAQTVYDRVGGERSEWIDYSLPA